MFRRFHHRLGHYLLLGIVWAALTLPNLGAARLWDIDEGNNAEAAREMWASDNWTIPTFNFVLRTDKPALLYWLQIAGYELFGVNEFAARLPSALAALLAMLATYELGRQMSNPLTGLLAGLILACAPAFCAAAHFANPDALLTAFTALTLLLFWWGYSRGNRGWFVPAGICTGLAVLAKGPVGLVLPAAVALSFLFWSRQLGRLRDRWLAWGTLAHVLVVAPWYAWVGVETKAEFLKGFFLTHNLSRFGSPMENHRGFPAYYVFILLAGFLPWSAFFGPALVTAWKKIPGEQEDAAAPLSGKSLFLTLGVTALGLYAGVFGYTLGFGWYFGSDGGGTSAVPGATLWHLLLPPLGFLAVGGMAGFLLAWLILCLTKGVRRLGDRSPRLQPLVSSKPLELANLAPAVRFLFCWIAVYFVFFSLSGTKLPNYILPLYPPVAILLARFLDGWRRRVFQPPDWVVRVSLACFGLAGLATGAGLLVAGGRLGGATLLQGRELPGLENWAWAGLFPAVGALLAAAWVRRQRVEPALATLAASALLFLGTLAAGTGQTVNDYKAPSSLADLIQAHPNEPDIRLACYDYFQPSLVFYCGREVDRFQSEQEVRDYLRWPLPVYLFVPASTWEMIESQMPASHRLVGRHHDLYRNCDVVVVTNR